MFLYRNIIDKISTIIITIGVKFKLLAYLSKECSFEHEVATWQVRWLRLLYIDFSIFTRDQENLISLKGMDGDGPTNGFDYVEGSVITDERLINNWRSSFFSTRDQGRISSLANQHGMIYCLELSKYYSHFSVDKVLSSVQTFLGRHIFADFAF